MYRRGDPRWNRTLQNITDTVEHANESAQEGLYSFTFTYVNPCLQSFTQCLNDCTAPCFPAHNDRRRHRARSRGIAEQSFDFYDDWEEDESEGLLGWGNDNMDRLWGGASNYGSVSQPGPQRNMSYGNRSRDNRYDKGRRKSAVQPHDGGPDPTIIPSSSYFGFLGRLPFNVGGKTLRYKPSAADLTEHPGVSRRDYEQDISEEEGQPLMEESGEDEVPSNERKGHGRKRSQTGTSGHTTDSLSSRGDIFPSEDELDDAVPLDDEFAVALERRTTGQSNDDFSSGKTKHSGGKTTKRASSQTYSRSASAHTRRESLGRATSTEASLKRSASDVDEIPTLSELKQEEERARIDEEADIERKRNDAQNLALRRGLIKAQQQQQQQQLQVPAAMSSSTTASPGTSPSAIPTPQRQLSSSSLSRGDITPPPSQEPAEVTSPYAATDSQTMPESCAFYVDESDMSSVAPTPNRPLSLHDETREQVHRGGEEEDSGFVPARLPHFGDQGH